MNTRNKSEGNIKALCFSRRRINTNQWVCSGLLPGIAGQTGAEQCVSDGDGDEMLMEPAVHPAVWYDVVAVAYGTT